MSLAGNTPGNYSRVIVIAMLCFLSLFGCGGEQSQQLATTAGVDATGPTVSQTSPANNTSAVSLNSAVSASFSEPINVTTLDNSSFVLRPSGGGSTVGGTVRMTGNTATFTPNSPLAGNTQYTATINSTVTDLAGNAMASDYSWRFTTGAAPDTTPPTVSATSPANGAVGVALNASVSATFSEAMDNATLSTATFILTRVTAGSPTVGGTVSVSGNTATFTPTSSLAGNTQYRATITTGATDAAGNALAANYIWTFTTDVALDTTPPTVSAISPVNNATGVTLNTAVSATFSEAMNNATLTTATFTLQPSAGGTAVAGAVNVSGNTATLTPMANLAGSTQYTATIASIVTDAAGNALGSNYSWQFTTGPAPDTTPPTVSSTSPSNGATNVTLNSSLSATFSEPMNNATLTTATFTLRPTAGGGTIAGTVNVSGNTATFTPTASLTGSTQYTARIASSVTDAAGNALGSNYSWQFTTGPAPDTTPPTVSATSPASSASDVAVNSPVTATFSESMKNSTLTTATFTLRPSAGGANISGTVNVSSNTATFTPTSNLAEGTQYTATISSSVTDAAGNALGSNYVWTFSTAATTPTGTADLAWDAVTDPRVAGYRVYYGTSPGVYLQSPGAGLDAGMSTTYTVTGLTSGVRYYFAVTTYGATESSYSNEVSKLIP